VFVLTGPIPAMEAVLVHHLRRTGGPCGPQTMCEGGGMANATLIELL
jgi:acetyl-CoA C-acetyltransferase